MPETWKKMAFEDDCVLVADTDASGYGFFLDEDNMASDDATKFASQQSIKKYVDDNAGGDTEMIELNILLNAFRIAINGSLVKFNMVDGIMDEFEDESGVDTGTSTGEAYDSANDLYSPTGTEVDLMEYATDGAAQAAYVSSDVEGVDTNFETGGDGQSWIGDGGGTDFWHTIKVVIGADIICTSASIYLEGVNGAPTGDLTFRIETDDGDEPSGDLVHASATGTIANGSISQPAWNKCSFTSFSLSAGTYWLVVYIPDQGNDVYWKLTKDADGSGRRGYSADHATNWTMFDNDGIFYHRIYALHTQCYSEDTIKEEGSYSLKGIAAITNSLNDTLTKTVGPTVDLSGIDTIKFDIRSSRTGSNIKIGIHDSGGTTSENTPNIASANVWQGIEWDVSGVSDANKDDIDSIIITIVNADAANTFYIDDIRGAADMSLVSNSTEAEANPSSVRIVLMEEDVDAITEDTDLKAYASRDNGGNWVQATLTDEGDYGSGKRILTGTADVSGQASDKTVKWKVTTHNDKDLKLHGVGLLWS